VIKEMKTAYIKDAHMANKAYKGEEDIGLVYE
jgi:hypothetical protein